MVLRLTIIDKGSLTKTPMTSGDRIRAVVQTNLIRPCLDFGPATPRPWTERCTSSLPILYEVYPSGYCHYCGELSNFFRFNPRRSSQLRTTEWLTVFFFILDIQ